MGIQDMNRNALQQLLLELDQASYNHLQWHNNLIRTICCRLSSDKHDMLPNAYKECRFGQWYYANTSKDLIEHAGFKGIREAHKSMHELAGNILLTLEAHDTVSTADYDNFANSLERLRLEISAFKNELESLLYTRDPLTMTINRVNMLPMLREQHDLVKRQSASCCLAMMDLDSFKKINDEHGHIIGDNVLASLSHFLIEHLRPYDKVFRYGGEEFLLCMLQVNSSQAYKIIDRLREEIAKTPIDVGLPKPINISVSFGVATLDANSAVEEAIDHADKALYIAKSSGKNMTHAWSIGD